VNESGLEEGTTGTLLAAGEGGNGFPKLLKVFIRMKDAIKARGGHGLGQTCRLRKKTAYIDEKKEGHSKKKGESA